MFIKNVQSSQSRTWLNGKAFLIIMLVFFSMTVGAENVEGLTVTSSSFTNNANIPLANAGNAWGQCFGSNISPQLSLGDVPSSTRAFALIMDDPDAQNWVHWLMYWNNPGLTPINENSVPSGAVQGNNDIPQSSYFGPCPPGANHRYYIRIYALDTTLSLSEGFSRTQLDNAMSGHILQQTFIMGWYPSGGTTCTYTITPRSYGYSSQSAIDTITVTPSSSSCTWAASSSGSWITITSGESGMGSGTVTYSVAENTTGAARTGTMTIGGQTVTIRQAKSVFNDVTDPTYWAYPYIYAIYTEGITVGCGNNNYCSYDSVTRGQMAAFIIRAKYGENFNYTLTPYFSDVPATHVFFKYVQKLRDDGITAVSGTYGVDSYVTRGQMAAFIIRALYGEDFNYTQTPYFSDVPSTHGFFKYIQKLKDHEITSVTGVYNVDSVVTREQMAAFLSRAFLGMQSLPTYNIADYYPYSVGNQWNYTSGQAKITGIIQISNENVLISKNTLCDCGRDDYLTVDERGMLFWGNTEEGIFPQPLVAFPPTWRMGEKKRIQPESSFTIVLKLEGLEDVTTAAGEFKSCLRFSVSASNGEHYEEVLHFAKGVGPVRTQRLTGSSPNSGCFLAIEADVCCPTCNWTQDLVSAVINGINIP